MITTEDVDNILRDDKKIKLKIPLVIEFEFYTEKIIDFIREIEKISDLEIVLYSDYIPEHTTVEIEKSAADSTMEQIERIHFDLWPSMEVLVSMPKNEENEKLVENTLQKYVIFSKYRL